MANELPKHGIQAKIFRITTNYHRGIGKCVGELVARVSPKLQRALPHETSQCICSAGLLCADPEHSAAQRTTLISATLGSIGPSRRSRLLHLVVLKTERQADLALKTCVLVSRATRCMGPLTHAGCRAICPAYSRGCYGCFGPMESPNTEALISYLLKVGVPVAPLQRLLRGFTGNTKTFRSTSDKLERGEL
jgi:hypothetical protein